MLKVSLFSESWHHHLVNQAIDNDVIRVFIALLLMFMMLSIYIQSVLKSIISIIFILFSIGTGAFI